MFIHMLGYPTQFGQMQCLKLVEFAGFSEKRIGYLGLMLLLDERPEVAMLLTNSLKQDLNHSNEYIVGLALCALGNSFSAEMARLLAPEVERLLQSRYPNIQKKAALCCIKNIKKAPDLADNFVKPAATLLRDTQHGVKIAGVQLCTDLCKVSVEALKYFRKNCTELVANVLKGIVNCIYSHEYGISGITDPFLHIRLLRLLRCLGQGDADASDCMDGALAQVATKTGTVMRIPFFTDCLETIMSLEVNSDFFEVNSDLNVATKPKMDKNMVAAILYECVKTIMSIENNNGLRVHLFSILGRLLSNNDKNIRYVALNMLVRASAIDVEAVQTHRTTILECVKDADPSIRMKALELSFLLVTKNSMKLLTKELMDYLNVIKNSVEILRESCLHCWKDSDASEEVPMNSFSFSGEQCEAFDERDRSTSQLEFIPLT